MRDQQNSLLADRVLWRRSGPDLALVHAALGRTSAVELGLVEVDVVCRFQTGLQRVSAKLGARAMPLRSADADAAADDAETRIEDDSPRRHRASAVRAVLSPHPVSSTWRNLCPL